MLSKEEFDRYRKQVMVEDIGIPGQLKLKQSKVVVIGGGGLGCPVLQYLSSVGVGTIGIVDFDTIEVSNLHRQVLYTHNDLGKSKVTTAIQKLKEQNPFTNFIAHSVQINNENAESIIADYDIVIDGCDNFMTRYTVNDACVKLNKPLVYGSILGYEGQLAVFNYKGSKNLRTIFPEPPAAEDVPSCSENGVLGTVPAVIGTLMAQETINVIMEKTSLQNTFLIYNCREMTVTKLNY